MVATVQLRALPKGDPAALEPDSEAYIRSRVLQPQSGCQDLPLSTMPPRPPPTIAGVLSSAPPRPWLPAGVQEGACHTANMSPVNCVTRSPTALASLTATRAQTSTQQALPAAAQLPVELDHTVPGSFLMAPVKAGNGQGTRSGLACKRPSISRCRVALRHVRGSCTGDGSGWFRFLPEATCGHMRTARKGVQTKPHKLPTAGGRR